MNEGSARAILNHSIRRAIFKINHEIISCHAINNGERREKRHENARTTVIIISSIFGASIAIPALMGMLTINAVMTCFGLMCVASISSILIAWGIVTMIKNTIKREIDFDTMIGYWILACIGGGIGWTALNGQLVAEWIVIGYIFFFAVMLMIISMVVILLALVVNTVIDAIKEHARERVQEIKIEKCIVKNKH